MNADDVQAHFFIGIKYVFKFVLAKQAVVDEDASQVLPYRLVEQHGCHGAVDATRETEYDLVVAQLLFKTRHRVVNEGVGRPIALATADAKREIGQHLRAFLGVEHLGVELHGIGLLAFNLLGGILDVVGRSDDAGSRRQFGDGIAMAHPHLTCLAYAFE